MTTALNPTVGQLSDVLTLLTTHWLSPDCDVDSEDFLVVVAPLIGIEPLRAGEPQGTILRRLATAAIIVEDAAQQPDTDWTVILDQQAERIVQSMLTARQG